MNMQQINNSLEHIEKNILNYSVVPGLSTVCGAVRAIIGIAQVVFGGLGFLLTVLTKNNEGNYYAQQHFMHGWLNLIRASVEIIPFFNMILIPYDFNSSGGPGFRFNYISYQEATNPMQLTAKAAAAKQEARETAAAVEGSPS